MRSNDYKYFGVQEFKSVLLKLAESTKDLNDEDEFIKINIDIYKNDSGIHCQVFNCN